MYVIQKTLCIKFNKLHVIQNISVLHSLFLLFLLVRYKEKEGEKMEFQYNEMGRRIKIRRRELKIKQAELAEALEISNNHMSSIENGRQKPSLDTFIGICRCLRVTPDYLLLGTMHTYNIPQDITDKLRLCSQPDIMLAKDIIELLVERNSAASHNTT